MFASKKKNIIFLKTKTISMFLTGTFYLSFPMLSLGVNFFSTYENAEIYDNDTLPVWTVDAEALKNYSFHGDESVLEIGCRGGRTSANIAGRIPNGEIIAIDERGPGVIEFASKNHSRKLYPNLTFSEQNFLESVYENQFDLVVSLSSITWYSDQEKFIQKVYHVLKENGQFLFNIALQVPPEILELRKGITSRDEWKTYYSNYSHPRKKYNSDEYAAFLSHAGFQSIEIKTQIREYLFANKRELIDFFKTHPLVAPLPEDKVEDFLVVYVNAYSEKYMHPDGQIPFIFNELSGIAGK